jgi:hypothetical protein
MRFAQRAPLFIAAYGAAALVTSATGPAAAGACSALSNPVYVSGSSAFAPVLQAVANALGSAVSIVYTKPGSCEGLDLVLKGVLDTNNPSVLVPNGSSGTCTYPTAGGTVDIAISDVYPATCQAGFDPTLPSLLASQKDFLGPVQSMTFAVPSGSSEAAISAAAAYVVFGFDASTPANTISPWTVPGDIFVRFWDSGTINMLAPAIGLVPGKWANATNNTSAQTAASTGAMQTDILTAGTKSGTDTNATIGILSSSGLKTGLAPLAFKAKGQSCAYYPDSTRQATDKINVRQGRYAIWGPTHLVANVDASGAPLGQNSNTAPVQMVMQALVATSQAPGTGGSALTEAQVGTLIDAISPPVDGYIPLCAMQVSRTTEIGPEASYAPPAACSCRFEMAAAGSPVAGHTCTACTSDLGCSGSTPACNFGYCEAE